MLKKFFLLMMALILFCVSNTYASENITILVNDSKIYSDVKPFIINEITYVPLRFISTALSAKNILWSQTSQSVTIAKDDNTLQFFINKNYAYINGKLVSLTGTPLIKSGRTFVPLRIISENLGATVGWDDDTNTVSISTSKPVASTASRSGTTTSRQNFQANSTINYTENDAVYWLSRIIEAEAGAEPYKGKVAVGEVILNRVKSPEFPNTIWGVIFDKKYAIQFEPVANGTIYNTPSNDSIKAAKEALSGSNYVKGALYFLNPKIASSKWISQKRQYCTTVSNHDFYL